MRTRQFANALASMEQDHPLYDLRKAKANRDTTSETTERERLQLRAAAAIGCDIHELREIL